MTTTTEVKKTTPQNAEQMIAALKASLKAARLDAKRDELSCPCCGTPTDSSYCEPCDAATCGEHHFRSAAPCMVELRTKGFTVAGTCVERVQLPGGDIELCRVEIWRGPKGAHSYGRVLEVLS